MTQKYDLSKPAQVGLGGAATIGEMAEAIEWTPALYALSLAKHIRAREVPLDMQRERLASLSNIGAGLDGEQASAEELAQHSVILDALFFRFTDEAVRALSQAGPRSSEIAERFLNAALKAQRAGVSVLSALATLRDRQRELSRAPDNASAPGIVGEAES